MTDIAVGVRGIPERTSLKTPLYGVMVDEGGKKPSFYICKKADKSEGFVDIVGFKSDLTLDTLPDLPALYNLVESIDRSIVHEISFPWSRVVSLRNLSFRAK